MGAELGLAAAMSKPVHICNCWSWSGRQRQVAFGAQRQLALLALDLKCIHTHIHSYTKPAFKWI